MITLAKLPGLNCGHCNNKSCTELANKIVAGEKSIGDCYVLQQKKEVVINIENKEIPLLPFAQDIIRNSVLGMIRSLKQTSINGDEYILITVKKKKPESER